MKIFISWSGKRSKCVAKALRDWLPMVLQYVEPWMSEADIDAGARGLNELAKELADSRFGIICLTPENLDSNWIHFEAGAISKALETSKVSPVLFDLDVSDVSAPLGQFQAKKLDRSGLWDIICSIQKESEASIPEDRAGRLLDRLWPDFEKCLIEMPEDVPVAKKTRTESDILEDLVSNIRAMDSRLQNIEISVEKNKIGQHIEYGIIREPQKPIRSDYLFKSDSKKPKYKHGEMKVSITQFTSRLTELAYRIQPIDEFLSSEILAVVEQINSESPEQYHELQRLIFKLAEFLNSSDKMKRLNVKTSEFNNIIEELSTYAELVFD